MRVVHLTDLHVQRPSGAADLLNKRLLGVVNLHVLGRAHHFSAAAAEALVRRVTALTPDLVVCTGDLTALALESEFVAAPVRVATEGGATWVLIDVCHPDWASRGWLGDEGLRQLDDALGAGAIVMLHYPLRNRRGERYGPWTRACIDAAAIEALCVKKGVSAILHGHEHHGFTTKAEGIPIYDPGASGYAFLPDRGRTAHFCVYDVRDGRIAEVTRHRFDGQDFVEEPGGAWASGG